MYFWINFLLWTLGVFWFGLFFALGLEPRWDKVPRWALAAGFTLLVLPFAYLKITHPLLDALYWTAIALTLLYIFVAFRDKPWKKCLLFLLFTAVTEISEVPVRYLSGYTGISFDASFDSLEMVFSVAATSATLLMFSALLLIVWTRFIARKTTVRRIHIFFIFPFSQLFLLFAFSGSIPEAPSVASLFASVGALLGLLADYILLYILMGQGQKETLAQKLQELETLQRVEEVHYQAIEARRGEMAKLRHDFSNQLMTAYHLVEQGETKQARGLLDALRANLSGTNEYQYCGNAVVNAVLNEKAAVCQAEGIRLETELELGEEPFLQPVHLCSIFVNLLDNAVRAAKECPASERLIAVKAARKEDYLHIKVENAALAPKKTSSRPRKGYGQEILRDIALQYGGEFMTDWNDGTYRAMISLTASERGP